MTGVDSPIKLAEVVHALCLGGSEVLAWRLARSLNRSGQYVCSLYGVARGGPLKELLRDDGIPSYSYVRKRPVDLPLIVGLARQLRRNGIEIVHTHHIGQLLCGGVAARLAGAKLVHTEHDSHSLMKPRTQRVFRVLAPLAAKITTVSVPLMHFLRDELGIHPAKLESIPNGVLVEAFQNAEPVPRDVFGWRESDVVMTCVARLEAEKGHQVLLTAFEQLRRRWPHAKLLIVGDGSLRPALQAQVHALSLEGSVRFLGARDDIPALLAASDLFVLPSLKEGVPLSILEAMAAGKPVVASSVGAVSHIVQEGRTGFLVEAGNSQALAGALSGLVADEDLRRTLGQHGRQTVSERYHFDRTVAAYRRVYEAVLGSLVDRMDSAVERSVVR